MAKFTIGADIELMLKNTDGELVSAIGVLSGTKEEPQVFDNGSIFRDNVNAEFNMLYWTDREKFKRNITAMVRRLRMLVSPLVPNIIAGVDFPLSQLDNDEARVFGCIPDGNAWTQEENVIPFEATEQQFRSAGGHVHIGSKFFGNDLKKRVDTIKIMDILIGIPSIWMDNTLGNHRRRELYGKAGAHRPTEYGVEYRTLSPFWIHSAETMNYIFDMATTAAQIVESNRQDSIIAMIGGDNVVSIINNNDLNEAKNAINIVCKKVKLPLPQNIWEHAPVQTVLV